MSTTSSVVPLLSLLAFLLSCVDDDDAGELAVPPAYIDHRLVLVRYTHGLGGVSEGGEDPPSWTFEDDSLFVNVPDAYAGIIPFGLATGAYHTEVSRDSVELLFSERPPLSPVDPRDLFVLKIADSDGIITFTYLDRSTEVFSASFDAAE